MNVFLTASGAGSPWASKSAMPLPDACKGGSGGGGSGDAGSRSASSGAAEGGGGGQAQGPAAPAAPATPAAQAASPRPASAVFLEGPLAVRGDHQRGESPGDRGHPGEYTQLSSSLL
mmetsp:Transcript_90962/g.257564  ORF Transcript_90962/g.257564 Transcript_90962/m.257564 type:complete len:117 (-) Transcript_90962:199-549(-)